MQKKNNIEKILIHACVPHQYNGQRLDKVVLHLAIEQSKALNRSQIAGFIARGFVFVDNHLVSKAGKIVHQGQLICVYEASPVTTSHVETISHSLASLVHEEEHFIIIEKSAGAISHAPGHDDIRTSIASWALLRYPEINGVGEANRHGIVHRLDVGTTGLMIIARTVYGYERLKTLFQERKIEKEYIALVEGAPPASGNIIAPIIRHPIHRLRMSTHTGRGRDALTAYMVLAYYKHAALVLCRPKTGRTHQIRVHMAHIKHPLVGDTLYGAKRNKQMTRPALHASKLAFIFDEKQYVFESQLPEDMVQLVESEKNI